MHTPPGYDDHADRNAALLAEVQRLRAAAEKSERRSRFSPLRVLIMLLLILFIVFAFSGVIMDAAKKSDAAQREREYRTRFGY
jgi:hypothetical protein